MERRTLIKRITAVTSGAFAGGELFSSCNTGATKTLRYLQVPGKYDGNYASKKADKACAAW